MPPPEAVLTELVIMTLLAAVAEAHHTLSMAVGALDRVKDCREERRDQTHTHTHACRWTNTCAPTAVIVNPDILHIAKRRGFILINLQTDVLLSLF